MQLDLNAVLAGVVKRLNEGSALSGVQGRLTGERQAGRAQLAVSFLYDGQERTYLYHVRREDPVHTIARSLADDTVRTLSQRIYEGVGGRLQPNDVYYPTVLGNVITQTPGQPSEFLRR